MNVAIIAQVVILLSGIVIAGCDVSVFPSDGLPVVSPPSAIGPAGE